MLAEMAAINAAFATIKTTIAHGKDIASAGNAISKFISGEEDLRERANKKKASFWHNVVGNAGDDMEEFMALEKVKEQREQIREMMQLYGRPGMFTDWTKFQAEARKKRAKLKEEQKEAREKLVKNFLIFILGLVLLGGTLLIVYVAWYLKTQG